MVEQAEKMVWSPQARLGSAFMGRPWRPLRTALSGAVVALALAVGLAGGVSPARGQSGELAPGAFSTGDLGQRDVVIVCDDRFDRRVKSCQLRNAAGAAEGSAADVGGAGPVTFIRRGDLFGSEVTITATSFGAIRCAQFDGGDSFCDICQTTLPPTRGSPRERERGFNTCVRITNDGESTAAATVGPFTIFNKPAGECAELTEELRAPSGPFTDPQVGWTAAANIAEAAQPGFVHIGLCSGRSWAVRTPPTAAGVAVMEDVGIIFDEFCMDGWCFF